MEPGVLAGARAFLLLFWRYQTRRAPRTKAPRPHETPIPAAAPELSPLEELVADPEAAAPSAVAVAWLEESEVVAAEESSVAVAEEEEVEVVELEDDVEDATVAVLNNSR